MISSIHKAQPKQISETYRIFEEIINGLDDDGINELFGGDGADIDKLFMGMMDEIYGVMYTGNVEIDLKPYYLDKLSIEIEEVLRRENLNYFITSVLPEFIMGWHHMEWGNLAMKIKKLAILAARDHGKCVSPETLILMFDGSIKKAKDILVGDKLMGVDSKSRIVLSTHSGIDKNMFRVHQTKGMSYDVNSKHELTLIHKNRITKKKEIIDIGIDRLLKFSKNWIAERYKGFKVGVDFKGKDVPLDPYYLGLWLGDGTRGNTSVTNIDKEVRQWLIKFGVKMGMSLTIDDLVIKIKRKIGTEQENKITKQLRNLGVINKKFIPEDYIINSRDIRLQVLAGLLDSDGTLRHGTFKISSIYRELGLGIERLANSLGFFTRFHEQTKFNKKIGRDYYNCYVVIGGNIEDIPTKIKRKKANKYVGRDKPSNKNHGIIDDVKVNFVSHLKIENIGEGKYVGFTVDKDNRFLLGDGTVTHNSYFFSHAYILWQLYKYGITSKLSKRPTMNSMANKRGFLFSFSIQQAVDLLDIVKNTITDNAILREKLYPGSVKDGWAKIDITCKNGARLTVRGFGSSVRGAHPGWIIVDDPLKDNAIYSSVQRKKGIDYFHSVIMNMVVPDGDVKVVGTPFHANDLYGDLKSKKGWTVREYPAIFPNGDILWEERWDFAGLMEKRNTQGNMIFSRELLCRPVTNESSIFPPEIIAKSFFKMQDLTFVKSRDNYGMKFNRVVTGCDFSISSSIGADYSVFITAGVDEEERLWLMNFVRFKGKSFADQIAVLKSINSRFKPDVFMLETNVFQQIFADESGKQGLPVVGHNTGKDKYDFKHGVPGLALAFERGMIKIPRGDQESIDIADTISLELSSITWTEKGLEGVGEHDDCGMALWQTWLASKHTGGFRFRFL